MDTQKGDKEIEGKPNSPKGESQPQQQKGAPSTSDKTKPKHEKDESSGADENTTKKQENSV